MRVDQGEPAQAIAKLAGPMTPVILPTRGCAGLTRWPLGTGANRVAHSGQVGLCLARRLAAEELLARSSGPPCHAHGQPAIAIHH